MYIVKYNDNGKEKIIVGDFSPARWGDEVLVSSKSKSVVIKKDDIIDTFDLSDNRRYQYLKQSQQPRESWQIPIRDIIRARESIVVPQKTKKSA